jgi:predicted dehydrogenase
MRISGIQLVAAADPDAVARARTRHVASLATHERAEDLLARHDIDAVVISVPTHRHAEVALAAAAAGKHFYLEKPIATTVDDARRVSAAVAQTGVISAVGFNRRLHPVFQQARAVLLGGQLGRVRSVQTAFCERTSPDSMPAWKRSRATGGGVLLDLASHHVDLLRWFLGDEVAEISATVTSEESEHDSAYVQLVMQNGVHVQSIFTFRAGLADSLEFFCERGTLRVDRHRATFTMRVGRRFGYGVRRAWMMPSQPVASWWLRRLIHPSEDPSYHRALHAFVQKVRGHISPVATLADGVRSLDAILAAEESARIGATVRVTNG